MTEVGILRPRGNEPPAVRTGQHRDVLLLKHQLRPPFLLWELQRVLLLLLLLLFKPSVKGSIAHEERLATSP